MPRIRWTMILMCFLANVINFIDRANLAIAAPSIRADLGLSESRMGLVMSAFFLAYALFQIPAARLDQAWGSRRALPAFTGTVPARRPRSNSRAGQDGVAACDQRAGTEMGQQKD